MKQPASAAPPTHATIVAVTLGLYRWLLLVHPAPFRRAYASQIAQVFRQCCYDAYSRAGTRGVLQLWLPTVGDLLAGALAEYREQWKGSVTMPGYRRAATMIFGAYITFVVTGLAFNQMSEGIITSRLPTEYPTIAIAYGTLLVSSVIALLAVLVGGLPIALAAVRYAITQRRWDIVARFSVPPVALALFFGVLALLKTLNLGGTTQQTIHSPLRVLGFGILSGVFVLAAIVSTSAVISAISRSEIDERLFRFALVPGAVATLAMLIMALAVATWSVTLWQTQNFFGNQGVLATNTAVTTLTQLAIMVVATCIAARAVLRGRQQQSDHAPAAH